MLTIVPEGSKGRDECAAAGAADGSSLIDEIVREGARRMLAEALQAEVEDYIARFADCRDEAGRAGHACPRQSPAATTETNYSVSRTAPRRKASSSLIEYPARRIVGFRVGEVLKRAVRGENRRGRGIAGKLSRYGYSMSVSQLAMRTGVRPAVASCVALARVPPVRAARSAHQSPRVGRRPKGSCVPHEEGA